MIFKSHKGFTLIEIMIVLAILAATIVVGAPRIFRTQDNIKSAATKMMSLAKEVRTKARLTNSTYRIVINIDEQEPTYWVERASGAQPVDPKLYEKLRDNKGKSQDENAPPPLFQMDKSILKKETSLPNGIRFKSLETISTQSPITAGYAYIHFFPEGFVEASALQIANAKNFTWTLVFNPLTGQADIVQKASSLKDIQR